MKSHVFLVPGFFGFANLGDLHYFHHVTDVLDRHFASLRRDVVVHRVETLPTAAIGRRAARLLEILQETAAVHGPIHLIGHSTGAVDARVLLDPARERPETAKLLTRVKSVVSVSGGHRGTPLASAFKTAFGKELLKLTAILTMRTLRFGQLPIAVVSALTATLAAFDTAVGAKPDLIDQIQEKLLDDLTPERREALHQLFRDVLDDQALLDELEPRMAQHTDKQTADRPAVRYACVLSESKKPGLVSTLSAGLSPYAQASHALYHALYRLTARSPATTAVPPEAVIAEKALTAQLGHMPNHESNDGIVPTLSQVHGPILRAVQADHHDVLGHFDDADHDPPHIDWMLSGSHFSRAQFEALWLDIANFVLDAERQSFLPA